MPITARPTRAHIGITPLDFAQSSLHTLNHGPLNLHHPRTQRLIHLDHVGFALLQVPIHVGMKPGTDDDFAEFELGENGLKGREAKGEVLGLVREGFEETGLRVGARRGVWLGRAREKWRGEGGRTRLD